MKTVFLFPGQGSQYVGMGKKLCENFAEAREVFAQVDEALGFSLSRLIFEGSDLDLAKTENTQPAILTVSVATYRVLQERSSFRPDCVAGHSLGEYSALVASGTLALADACRLVRRRGKLMQEAVPLGEGAMAAVVGVEADKVQELIATVIQEMSGVLSVSGYNSSGQLVISGSKALVERAIERALERGFRKPTLLNVSAPFHCLLMKPVEDGLRPFLEEISWAPLGVPYIANATAEVLDDCAQVKNLLLEQICLPVLWQQSVEKMYGLGARKFIEVGPGKVLCGLVKRCLPKEAWDSMELRASDLAGDLDPGLLAR